MDSTATDNIFAQRKRTNFVSRFRRRFQKPPSSHNQQHPPRHEQRFSQAPSPQVASSPVLAAIAKQDGEWASASRRGGGTYIVANPKRASVAPLRRGQQQPQSARNSRRRSVLVTSVADSLYSNIAVPEEEQPASVAVADPRHSRRTSHHRRRSGVIFSTSTAASALNAADDNRISVEQYSNQRQSTIHTRTRSLEMLLNELDALRKAGDEPNLPAEHAQQLVNRAARFSGSTSSTLSTASRLYNITALAAQSSHELGNRREVVVVTSPVDHAAQTSVVGSVPKANTSRDKDEARTAGNGGRDKINANVGNGWIATLGELLNSTSSSSTPVPPPPQQEKTLSSRHSFRSTVRDAAVAAPSSSSAASSPVKTISQLNAIRASLLLDKQPGQTRLSISAATNNSISTALPATSVSLATNNLRVVRVCRGTTYTGSMLRNTTAAPPRSGSRRKAHRSVAKNRRGSGDSGFEDGTEPDLDSAANAQDKGNDAGFHEEDDDTAWEDVNYEKDVWVASPQLQLADMGLRQKRRTVRRSVAFAVHDTVVVAAAPPAARPSPLRRLFRSR
ncbi:hypothetical protein BDZ88DRAFT_427146 [Geranomyces variabilis]|nr:hypothetical protein BDZ88DRAFT_427146 [Geranomyces variabilis]KAJ3132484.1 hypothetical protein HDU90_006845 [Geranomyces variabilis]